MSENGAGLKYKIQSNDQVGRYLVASKDLEAGEEILTELPVVVGPKNCVGPLCLSCYSPWPMTPENPPLCSACRWPVCNEECEKMSQHKDYECPIFAAAGEKFNVSALTEESTCNGIPQLECIMVLRLLLESEKNPERWNAEVKSMEAHNAKRIKKEQWKTDNVNVVNYIRNRLKVDRFSEEAIQTACGIIEINAHEIRASSGYPARALYPLVSLMNHSCVSNTSHCISPTDYRVHLRTTTKIPAGGELFGSYTHSFLPTLLRRENLLESKHFACACARCSDPTELNTHLSSLKCNKCDNGIVLAEDSLDFESGWKCTHCEFTTNGQAVMRVFKIIQAEVDEVEMISGAEGPESIERRESLIKKYHSVLHPKHSFFTTLRFSLCQLYGRVAEFNLDDLPDVVLEHKVDMCRLVLSVLDVIEPGLSRSRGLMLYELHAPLLFLAKSLWASNTIDNNGLKSKMIEAASILKESATILSLELPDTPEGQIGIGAKDALNQLEESINNL